ncbi:MAG: MG2 domain-containing protein, partial [Pseudomonadota bacterium]
MLRRFPAAFALISLILAAPPQAAAQEAPPVPERRLIFERDVDFFGDDLRAIFDTTVEACQAACLADTDCGAFTFNARSGACFPKRGIDRRDAYAGAISAAVVPMPVDIRTLADRRAAALSGLREVDLGAVRTEAEAIGPRYPRGTLPIEDLRAAAWDATDADDWARALRIWGEVVARTDDGEAWARYAEAARLFQSGDRSQQSRIRARAAPAALNGYLRSLDDRGAADALTTAAWALTDQGRGRASIPLLRLAVEVDPGSERESLLAEAIDRYGFRIAESRADSESAVPRLCVSFTEDLAAGTDYAPYVRLPGVSFAAEADGRQLCLEGVRHGTRYALTIRAGLPAENGDVLQRDANLSLYVRDRSPALRFPGRAYVLPQGPQTALPVVTVNAEQVDLTLYRVPERNLRSLIEEGSFGRPLDRWSVERFGELQGEEVWTGSADIPHNLDTALNTDVTTRLPLAEALEGQAPGLYALQAALPGAEGRDALPATQWFLTSDIGLATLQGSDGLHVFARSLGSAGPLEGLTVRLVSRANRVLGEAETDVEGHARFDPGLARGTGAGAPALLTVEAEGDFAFLPLTDPAFDLSDRGVEGRAAPGPIDLFLSTERGAYRAGDRIHATMIARDGTMQPLGGLPLTAVLMRPDGVEHSRQTVTADAGGGAALSLPTSGAVPRGTWRLAVYADPDADALAETSLLIEDFLPERIDAELSLPDGPLGPNDTTTLTVAARYLFGAPGAGLDVEGEVRVRNVRTLDAAPGFVFGRHDGATQPMVEPLSRVETDASGQAAMPLGFPDAEDPSGPLEAEVRVRVSEGSGRPIEREIARALTPEAPLIGVRPQFQGAVPEGAEAGFDVIAVGPDGASVAAQVDWTLDRVETRYQWYSAFGEWNWEPVTRRTRVASGTVTTGPAPVTVAAGVEWGRYELILERADGPYTATSVGFDAGWYAPADAAAAPDQLEVALDRAAYRPGDTALLRVEAQSAGAVLVTVLSDRLIDMQTVEVPAGASEISLMVTDAWGAGAYVAATLVRPLDGATGRAPVRALGLAHAAVDPGPLRLAAAFEGPGQATPRETMDVALRVEGLAPGEQGWATIAAVDQGILNLTGFEAPDAPEHFFGQRRLGVELRDVYGRLIDGRTGALGRVRSGGDRGTMMHMEAPPPTEDLVAYFSGPVAVDPDGLARASFDLPAFNGTVRLMGVVWGESGAVGMAEREVLVRDPVVVTASLPRFLAPNDESTLRLDLAHVDGAVGEMALSIEGGGVALGSAPTSVTLSEGEQRALVIPVTAGPTPGISDFTVRLTTPDGEVLTKELTLRVEDNDPPVARVSRFELDPSATFTLSRDVFTELRPGTGSATLALGPLARLNAP